MRATGWTPPPRNWRFNYNMGEKGRLALENFESGCNCSQAVLLAFAPECGLERETALRLASSFGGGFGRMRELCGAISGGGMVLGILRGYADTSDDEVKQGHYRLIQTFCERFREVEGHLRCGELLDKLAGEPGPVPGARTAEYYSSRPCGRLVALAADLVEELLGED